MIGLLSRIVIGVPLAADRMLARLGRMGTALAGGAGYSACGSSIRNARIAYFGARSCRACRFKRGSFAQIEMLAKANHMNGMIAEQAVAWTPPTAPLSEAPSFAADAWSVFHNPEFRPQIC